MQSQIAGNVSGDIVIFGRHGLSAAMLDSVLQSEGGQCFVYSCMEQVLEHQPLHQALVLIDCSKVEPSQVFQLLDSLERSARKPKVALANVNQDCQIEPYLKWSVVKGVFHQPESDYLLLKGVGKILSGGSWFSRRLLETFVEKYRREASSAVDLAVSNVDPQSLTRREREVLMLVATGASNGEIAEQLCLSTHTIKTHLYNLFQKLNVSNRLQAVNWAKHHLLAGIGHQSAATGR